MKTRATPNSHFDAALAYNRFVNAQTSLTKSELPPSPNGDAGQPGVKKYRGWIWYFAILAVLTVIATATLAVYNLKQQLKPEKVEAAIAGLAANGPSDYVLVYTAKKTEKSGEMNDHYVVKVRRGKAYEVLVNGVPLEERQLAYYGMHRLLIEIERFMEIDAEPGRPKTFLRGDFDAKTGALIRFIRRVMGSSQRLEINVQSVTVNLTLVQLPIKRLEIPRDAQYRETGSSYLHCNPRMDRVRRMSRQGIVDGI